MSKASEGARGTSKGALFCQSGQILRMGLLVPFWLVAYVCDDLEVDLHDRRESVFKFELVPYVKQYKKKALPVVAIR